MWTTQLMSINMIQPDSRLNIQWIDAGIQLLVFLRSQMEA